MLKRAVVAYPANRRFFASTPTRKDRVSGAPLLRMTSGVVVTSLFPTQANAGLVWGTLRNLCLF